MSRLYNFNLITCLMYTKNKIIILFHCQYHFIMIERFRNCINFYNIDTVNKQY